MNNAGKAPELIVMLTYNDYTTEEAEKIFEDCKESKARFWGFKEKPLSPNRMNNLYHKMKDCGKTTFLEVVSYTEKEGLDAAKLAADCGCDVLMGTKFFKSISDFCRDHNLKYMPFVGEINGRPSILSGTIREIIDEANEVIEKGAFGIDLLGYRYEGDAVLLNNSLVKEVKAPVCLAGSIDSFDRLDEVKSAKPWAFTIGSAFFDGKFNGSFSEQIDKVCHYMAQEA